MNTAAIRQAVDLARIANRQLKADQPRTMEPKQ